MYKKWSLKKSNFKTISGWREKNQFSLTGVTFFFFLFLCTGGEKLKPRGESEIPMKTVLWQMYFFFGDGLCWSVRGDWAAIMAARIVAGCRNGLRIWRRGDWDETTEGRDGDGAIVAGEPEHVRDRFSVDLLGDGLGELKKKWKVLLKNSVISS